MDKMGNCEKTDHDFPNGLMRGGKLVFMKCGHPLPCPWHTVVIDTAGPRVHIPETAGLTQPQRRKIRELAVQISDALEDE
jgi:hypothetical protein